VKLAEAARILRSKNAGPTMLTLDIMFDDPALFDRALTSTNLRADAIGRRFGCQPDAVRVIPYPLALALKIVLPRAILAGSPGDRDVYGAQQHGPLLDLEL
jgi:hypothetical protein